MKPNTSSPYPKQPEIGPYLELDKSISRITPVFIMVEFSITIRLRLGPPLDSYLQVFRLKLWVKISIFSMCFRSWSFYFPSFEQIKNIWYRAEVLTSGSRRSGPPFKVISLYWIHLFPFTDSVWMESNSVRCFYEISNKYKTQFPYKLSETEEKALLCTLTLPLN